MTKVFDQGKDHSRRELPGYGPTPPNPQWPNGAKVCVSFVLNYEEGGEHVINNHKEHSDPSTSTLNDDQHAEMFLTESGVAATVPGTQRNGRNIGLESAYEFGSHRGFHRILDLFKRSKLRFTSWSIGRAVELNPQVVGQMEDAGCEVASHSWRWIDYDSVPEEEERKHVRMAIEAIKKASPNAKPPIGWYTGRQSSQTRRIVYETYRELGLLDQLYDSDAYDEDLPYYVNSPSPNSSQPSPPLLVIPYTLDNNDMKFGIAPGFCTAEQFSSYCRDALDVLIEEGQRGQPKMMSIGLHCRIIGRPGRFKGLQDFVEYVKQREQAGDVWVATRQEIAQHWRKVHPPTI